MNFNHIFLQIRHTPWCHQLEIITFLGFYAVQIGSYRHFGTSYQSHVQGANNQRRLTECSKTTATSYKFTLHNIPEE